MEIWLDTINRKTIEYAKESGLLYGVTTNPSLLSHATQSAEEVLEELLSCFTGPLAVQVTEKGTAEMIEQGKDLSEYSNRIIVKVPATEEGIRVIARLTHAEIPTMATAVFTPIQALMSLQAGADYLAPYYSHIGEKAAEVMEAIQCLIRQQPKRNIKLLAASLKTPEEVVALAQMGCAAVTLKEDLFFKCLQSPSQTLDQLTRFENEWKKAPFSPLFSRRVLAK